MTEILFKPNNGEYRHACNVPDSKAKEFVQTKNRKHDYGTWKVN